MCFDLDSLDTLTQHCKASGPYLASPYTILPYFFFKKKRYKI